MYLLQSFYFTGPCYLTSHDKEWPKQQQDVLQGSQVDPGWVLYPLQQVKGNLNFNNSEVKHVSKEETVKGKLKWRQLHSSELIGCAIKGGLVS